MSFRVYVAAPLADALYVRKIHGLLRDLRMEPTSSWAETSEGVESLDAMPLEDVREIARQNDEDLLEAETVLVLPRADAGREMYAEARLATVHLIPVVWCGTPRPLTAYRDGVHRVDDLIGALDVLARLARIPAGPHPIADVLALARPGHRAVAL